MVSDPLSFSASAIAWPPSAPMLLYARSRTEISTLALRIASSTRSLHPRTPLTLTSAAESKRRERSDTSTVACGKDKDSTRPPMMRTASSAAPAFCPSYRKRCTCALVAAALCAAPSRAAGDAPPGRTSSAQKSGLSRSSRQPRQLQAHRALSLRSRLSMMSPRTSVPRLLMTGSPARSAPAHAAAGAETLRPGCCAWPRRALRNRSTSSPAAVRGCASPRRARSSSAKAVESPISIFFVTS
mmetsp:Transcript_10188/g.33385  ORF Transcript_10188/g.33385 Transcript_10188/m.33385 type:complete len:242 (+) Transcript_10188:67-792(+)